LLRSAWPASAALLTAALQLWASSSLAASTELQMTLQPQQQLARNAHTGISVVVQLPDGSANLPLLLTPRIEGAAVELVRGRLLRSDAKQTDATHLRFEIPVVARSEGTAILRVHLATYLCEDSCRRVELTASAVLEVR
jgi:hypothetical protein